MCDWACSIVALEKGVGTGLGAGGIACCCSSEGRPSNRCLSGADMCFDALAAADDLDTAFGGSETLRDTGVPGSSATTDVADIRGLAIALDRARLARNRGSSVLSLKNSRRS